MLALVVEYTVDKVQRNIKFNQEFEHQEDIIQPNINKCNV